jgi:hypothetical protein
MCALGRTQVDADPAFKFRLGAVEEMLQQHVFSRNGRVRLQIEHPIPVRALAPQQRAARAVHGVVQQHVGRGGESCARHVVRPVISEMMPRLMPFG